MTLCSGEMREEINETMKIQNTKETVQATNTNLSRSEFN
ncbi:MAG: hypothetical protein JWN25_3340 [Verrucomicrobiales bacterium]|nr:hypothetical protein [Verrucomicrobiales bacterium]